MNFNSTLKGMVCTVCEVYEKVPVQAKGAWVTRPVNNWAKATTLLANHEKSEWHLSAVERRAFSQSAEKRSDVPNGLDKSSEETNFKNNTTLLSITDMFRHLPLPSSV